MHQNNDIDFSVNDFFESCSNQIEIAQTIVAFANTEGGLIYLGKSKKGKTIGVLPTEVKKEISEIIETYTNGIIKFSLLEKLDKFKYYIELKIEKLQNGGGIFINPISNKKESFIRCNNENIKTPTLQIEIWKYKAKKTFTYSELTIEEKEILNFFQENNVISLSQIHKKSTLNFSKNESILIRLITRNLLRLTTNREGSFLERL